jgi:hypothetical protein
MSCPVFVGVLFVGCLALPSACFGQAEIVNSDGMGHGSFTVYPLLAAGDDPAQIKIALHNLDLVQEYIRAFLYKTLRQEKVPLLDAGNTSTPEVTVRIYGH